MRNLVAKIVSVFAVVFMSMNALGSGEDVTIMIAGVDGTIHFSVDYASDAFLLAGFEEAPLVLDVTNEEAPFIVDYVSVEIVFTVPSPKTIFKSPSDVSTYILAHPASLDGAVIPSSITSEPLK